MESVGQLIIAIAFCIGAVVALIAKDVNFLFAALMLGAVAVVFVALGRAG